MIVKTHQLVLLFLNLNRATFFQKRYCDIYLLLSKLQVRIMTQRLVIPSPPFDTLTEAAHMLLAGTYIPIFQFSFNSSSVRYTMDQNEKWKEAFKKFTTKQEMMVIPNRDDVIDFLKSHRLHFAYNLCGQFEVSMRQNKIQSLFYKFNNVFMSNPCVLR